jgi:signal transduction histidine kinase
MKNLLYCFIAFFPILLFAQSNDTLPNELKPIPAHFNKVMQMEALSPEQLDRIQSRVVWPYHRVSRDTALLLAQRMVEISKDFPDNSIKAKSYIILSKILLLFGRDEEAEQYLKKAKGIATDLKLERMRGDILKTLGRIEQRRNQYDIAVDYFLESLEVFEETKDSVRIFGVYYYLTGLYIGISMLDKAEEYSSKAAKIADGMDNNRMRIDVLSAQVSLLGQRATSYQEKAQAETEDTLILRALYMDSSYIYLDLVLETLERGLEVAEKSGEKGIVASMLVNMVATYNNKEDYQNAIARGTEAEKIIDALGDDYTRSQNYSYLAIAYLETKDYNRALVYAQKSLDASEKMSMEALIANSHHSLTTIHSKLGQYEKALGYLKKYDSYLLKTNDLEKVQIVTDSDVKYQTVKKENEILEQKNNILELETSNALMIKQRNGLILIAILLSVLGFLSFNFMKIRRDRNDRIAFAEALILAQESERKRIARDLHDGIGQSLLLIKKQLTITNETTSENNQLIDETLEEVRSISRDLHPFQLEKFGLTIAINDVIEKVEKSTKLFITNEIENIDGVFSNKEEIHFFRVIQEALNNIVKHAEATAAKVTIEREGNSIIAKVMDNGKGYDHELTIITSPKSLGLRTMHERIVSMGGRLKIEKNNPTGTIVIFSIPKK